MCWIGNCDKYVGLIAVDTGTEAGALAHGARTWEVLVAVNSETSTVVLASCQAKTMTRLWQCSAEALRQAMLHRDGSTSVVLLQAAKARETATTQ